MKKDKLQGYRVTRLQSIGGSFAVALMLAVFPTPAVAETVVRTGDSVSIGVNQTVENNLYAAAGSVTLSGEVKADMYAAAGSVTINGPVGADLTVIGGTVQTHAKVGDDIRVIGGDVVIAGEVGGDVFVFAGHLKILSSASVAGNVYFYGGEAEIEGTVTGTIMGQAETFFISSTVGGTDISSRRVTLTDSANIKGDLRYQSGTELDRAVNAQVEGEVLAVEDGNVATGSTNIPLFLLMAWLFTSLATLWFFRRPLQKLLINTKRSPARIGVIGLSGLVATPVLATILIATVLGAWVGIVLFLLFLLLSLVAMVLLPILLGGYLLGLYRKTDQVDILAVAVGMLTISLLSFVPFLGGPAIFAGFVITFGALLQRVYRAFRALA